MNDQAATALAVAPGDTLTLSLSCAEGQAPPPLALRVAGIAGFPFELTNELTVGMLLGTLDDACGGRDADTADLVLAASTGDPDAAATAIAAPRYHSSAHAAPRASARRDFTGE